MATTLRIAPLALLALLACNEQQQYETPHPADAFYYPQALALRHVKPGSRAPCDPGTVGVPALCQTQLLVASTDFDLRYDPANGGWLTVIDVDAAIQEVADQEFPVMPVASLLGTAPIASYAGQIAVVDEDTCPTWTTGAAREPLVLVPSRSANNLYRLHLHDSGQVECMAEDCVVPVHGPKSATGAVTVQAAQPYGMAVACGVLPQFVRPMWDDPAQSAVTNPDDIYRQRYYAFVGFLQIESSAGGMAQLDLTSTEQDPAATDPMAYWRNLGIGTPHTLAYDGGHTRLFATSRFAAVGSSPLRVLNLSSPSSGSRIFNLEQWVRGVQQRGIALSSDGQRAYVTLGFYDVTSAATYNAVPSLDLAGGLAVVDLSDLDLGGAIRVTDVARLDRGANEVAVIPRTATGQGDLVVALTNYDSSVWLYDVDRGAVANVFGSFGDCPADDPGATPPNQAARELNKNAPAPCRPGQPLVGKYPAGLAVETLANGKARIYISSFDRYWVNVITIDPAHPELDPETWYRFGPERT